MKQLFISILTFLIGITTMYLYSRNEVNESKVYAAQVLHASLTGIKANNDLAVSCSSAYDAVLECMEAFDKCDVNTLGERLDLYNRQRNQARQDGEKGVDELKRVLQNIQN